MNYGLLLSYGKEIALENIIYCSFDICALLLVVVVIFNYWFSKKLKSRSSALYSQMLTLTLSATVFDTLYLVTKYMVETPYWVYSTFNILFYLTYALTGILFLVYSDAVAYDGNKMPKLRYAEANTFCIVALGGVILSAVCLYGRFENLGTALAENVYEYIIYAAQLGAIITAMVVTFLHRKMLKRRHRLNVYLFLVLNMLASVLQLVLSWHVCCFALVIADLLLYITLQRPEEEVDSVSGLFNSKAFGYRVEERLKAGKPFYVFVAEINNISIVNTTFGIHGGNEVIKEASNRLLNIVPKGSNVYRLGGVRFATILNDLQEFEKFECDYPKVFKEPFEIGGSKMHLSATACRIDFPDVTDNISDVDEIIKYFRTDANSIDKILVADREAVERARRRQNVDYAVQRAVKNNTFKVYYQPIYSVKNDAINACEALIRLNDPELGFIPPDEFIPVAEQTGRIVEVGKIVMEEVCRFLKERKPEQYGIEFVDVNLSVIQCMHPEITADIDNILTKYGIPREMVNLEVTETASAQSYALLQTKLNELHQSGFTISLDDFGTGFSSVEYLINFPFDVVKLDKSLVWAYMSTKKYEPILKHYMPMLHGLGTKIVAEGVETIEMVNALKDLGCDYLQGYYYSKPIPEEDFMEFIKKGIEKTA